MRKILEIILALMFMITGCGVESIFNGGAFEWGFCFVVLVVVAWVLFGGGNNER